LRIFKRNYFNNHFKLPSIRPIFLNNNNNNSSRLNLLIIKVMFIILNYFFSLIKAMLCKYYNPLTG